MTIKGGCPFCGSDLVKRKAKKGYYQFYGCSRFPKCKGKMKHKPRGNYYVYIIRCKDGTKYIGQTSNLRRRMRQHSGKEKGGAVFVKKHGGMDKLLLKYKVGSRKEALDLENKLWKMERLE